MEVKRPKIKFSHDYFKFGWELKLPFEAVLLLAVKIKRGDVSPVFDRYDTMYPDGNEGTGINYYELPDSDLILLLFNHEDGEHDPFLFTTLRRYISRKLEYYKSMVGLTFDCVRIEEKKEAP